MKVAIVNGSPKAKGSASEEYARELEALLGEGTEIVRLRWNRPRAEQAEQEKLAFCDAAVFVFPLYVDGVPSHLLHILVELERYFQEAAPGRRPAVFGIVNCGFYEGDQSALALEMLRHWCLRAGCRWGMGIGIGCGPMLHSIGAPMGKGPKANLGRAYHALARAVVSGSCEENIYLSANFPRGLYKLFAHMGWRLEAKRNGLRGRDLGNAYGKSPGQSLGPSHPPAAVDENPAR